MGLTGTRRAKLSVARFIRVIRVIRGRLLSGQPPASQVSTRVAELFLPRGGESWRNAPRGRLAIDTAVEERRTLLGAIVADWEIWGPNGGYVAAIALRAAGAATHLRRPASFACHFLSVGEFDAST
jgi:hypothetical protein